jgi:hypothetical protein
MEAKDMYRIRSGSGAEAVYNSLEEFTAAVRRGEVAPEAEIFHSRANRWLDVKSHPHYRGAANWSGPLTADSIFSAPQSPAVPVTPHPQAHPVQSSGHNGAQVRLQIAEIPAPSTPAHRTVYRPQLVTDKPASAVQMAPTPQPAPPAPRVAPAQPVVKSREIPFIDVGSPTAPPQQNAIIIQAQRAPTQSSQAPSPPPVTKEPEFLVMDTGLERPVRTSNGHKAVTGDADMLFDTPVTQTLPPSQAASAVAPSAPQISMSPKPQVPPKSAAPVSAPTSKPVVAERLLPPVNHQAEPFEDLDIPGAPLLESPLLAMMPSAEPVPTSATRGSMGLVVGSGAVAMLAAGVLLFSRPWGGQMPATDLAATPPHSSITGTENSGVTLTTAAGAATATPPGTPGQHNAIPLAPAKGNDSAAAGGDEEVIAAERPNFHTDVSVPAADLDLGTDLPARAAVAAVAPNELALRLEAEEKEAQQDLASRLGDFQGLLAASQLGSSENVIQARNAWNGGADAIRQFRARIARLEQAYEDSVLASQRAQRWSGDQMRGWAKHQSLAEPAETSQLADLMLSQVAEGLDILASLDGQYEVRSGVIRFNNPASGARFLSIRTWVEQRMQSWASTPEGARPGSISLILRALGEGFPPVE